MPVVVIDLLFGLFVLGVGAALGWWLRLRLVPAGGDAAAETQQAREVLGRLHELASHMAADVGAHTSRVEEINEELTASGENQTDGVIAAVTKLIEANGRMQQQLGSAEEKLEEQARLVETHAAAALTDALTGLANRRAFDEEMNRRLEAFRAEGRVFSVVMLDVDHFKKFNDTYGHQAGDDVLRLLGELLRKEARKQDVVARYGGEEFAIICPGTTAREAGRGADRVRAAIAGKVFHCDGLDLNVTASLGTAAIQREEQVAGLIQRSDAALYASKEAGRNCVHFHDGRRIRPINGTPEPVAEAPPKKTAETPEKPRPIERPRRSSAKSDESATAGKPARPPVADGKSKTDDAATASGEVMPAISNRTEFCIILARRLAEWRRGGATPSVLMIRVDDYKNIVEANGSRVGMLVIKATAKFLSAAIRDMDLVAQYDSATFAVLFPGTWLTNVIRIAERLRDAIAKCSLPGAKGPLNFTVSIGGAKAMQTDDTKRLLERSVEALEAAEQSGGNCSLFHNGAWSETVSAAIEREEEVGHPAD